MLDLLFRLKEGKTLAVACLLKVSDILLLSHLLVDSVPELVSVKHLVLTSQLLELRRFHTLMNLVFDVLSQKIACWRHVKNEISALVSRLSGVKAAIVLKSDQIISCLLHLETHPLPQSMETFAEISKSHVTKLVKAAVHRQPNFFGRNVVVKDVVLNIPFQDEFCLAFPQSNLFVVIVQMLCESCLLFFVSSSVQTDRNSLLSDRSGISVRAGPRCQ